MCTYSHRTSSRSVWIACFWLSRKFQWRGVVKLSYRSFPFNALRNHGDRWGKLRRVRKHQSHPAAPLRWLARKCFFFCGQSEAGNSNASGTGSERVKAQELVSSYSKFYHGVTLFGGLTEWWNGMTEYSKIRNILKHGIYRIICIWFELDWQKSRGKEYTVVLKY